MGESEEIERGKKEEEEEYQSGKMELEERGVSRRVSVGPGVEEEMAEGEIASNSCSIFSPLAYSCSL
ncbi:hypothetical protein Q7C36_013742 [Tachysurus vachellii]|uniref:Uncharacterized protein n=1 Tax=Tachysurus vachellii TaxID=175792 RepID=A0AA88MJL0_TACVA|nr:hypothetical protein Q7C36_013742 [Tachysurus vachellii]